MINLVIVDDHPLVIDGIATMLKDVDWLQITGSCKTGAMQFNILKIIFIPMFILP